MKKITILLLFTLFFTNLALSEEITNTEKKSSEIKKEMINSNYNENILKDFESILNDLRNDRQNSRQEFLKSINGINSILDGVEKLTEESRREVKLIGYSESRNLLIASIFLWISITIFITMNLVFANNLKKELYFLRNGLLRSEIKENMVDLSSQLKTLNEKLSTINKGEI